MRHPWLTLLVLSISLLAIACANFDTQGIANTSIKDQQPTPELPAHDPQTDPAEATSAKAGHANSGEETPEKKSAAKPDAGADPASDPATNPASEGKKPDAVSTTPSVPVKTLPPVEIATPAVTPTASKATTTTLGGVTFQAPGDWKVSGTDFGAFATVSLIEDGLGRAIDLYRDAQIVKPVDQAAWIEAYRTSLSSSTKAGLKIESSDGVLTLDPEDSHKVQRYLFLFTTSGVIIAVVTTREALLKEDNDHALTLLASIEIADPAALHANNEAALGMTFSLPESWLAKVHKGTILARPPWTKAAQASVSLRWVNTTIEDDAGRLAFFAKSRSEIEDLRGGNWQLGEAEIRDFGANPGMKMSGTRGSERKTWLFLICPSRLITIITNDLVDDKILLEIAESLQPRPTE